MGWYFQHHTLADAVRRFAEGVVYAGRLFVQSLAIGSTNAVAMTITGLLMTGLLSGGLVIQWRRQRQAEVLGFTVTSAILLPAFAWGAMSDLAQTRYFFPSPRRCSRSPRS